MRTALKTGAAATQAGSDPYLFGDQNIESGSDFNTPGSAEAFPFINQTTGTAMSIHVYVDWGNQATTLVAGLYTDSNYHPGTRIVSGSLASPVAGAWNTVTINSAAVTAGSAYWVVVLGKGGALFFRDQPGGYCNSQSSSQSNLTSLPSTWSPGTQWNTCPISAYVMGTVPTGGSPPANMTLPQLSGTATQAQVLSTRNGTWTGSPTGYTYQWQDCNSSGTSCTSAVGATSSGYMLTSSDVGHTMRAVATASNANGSTPATSAASAVVTAIAPPPPPSNTALPVISGTTTQGQILSASNGTWAGSPTGYTYQWQECNTSGTSCANTSGTASSYTLTAGDVGHTPRVLVTASNTGGSTGATSAASAVVVASSSPPPADTALPQISGTTTQGQTLSTSTGTWSNSPTSYGYQWQDCNTSGTSCANISGANSSSYTLASSDVGHTMRSVLTATNAGGSGSATSTQTAAVAAAVSGGLPSGVTIQAIDGGTTYFGRWSNSFPTSSSFFPIAVFNQTLGYDSGSGTWDPTQLAAYKAMGVNTFSNLYNGYNSAMIAAIKNDGMSVIDSPLAQGYEGNALTAYTWFDEADGNNRCSDVPPASVLGETVPCDASAGRTPSTAISQVNADLHKQDPTRATYCQYTKPVAEDEGLTDAGAAAYVNANCDIVSFDSYIINDGWATNHDLWRQYDDVAHVRTLANNNLPVFPFIEAGNPMTSSYWSGITASPSMEVAEAWNAIIAGARGIQWFDHNFCSTCGSSYTAGSASDLIDSNSTFASLQTAVKAFNQRVTGLAPIINDPFANGYLISVSNPNPDSEDGRSANVMVKYDAASNDFYVFAAPTTNNTETLSFATAGGHTGPITVQGENRTVQATNGTFTDTFAGQTAVHIYIVPNS